jgi:hypothetical protein
LQWSVLYMRDASNKILKPFPTSIFWAM